MVMRIWLAMGGKIPRRKEKGERRREKGEGRKEKGEAGTPAGKGSGRRSQAGRTPREIEMFRDARPSGPHASAAFAQLQRRR